MSQFPLTNEQLKGLAPTLFTQEPHAKVSDKYHFIPTIDVIEEIRANNWYPISVSQASVRDEDKEGFQQHVVRFRSLDDLLQPKENAVELLLFNSHDRSKSFTISAGIFRFVCSNGLVIADNVFESYKIKHIGDRENDVVNAVANIISIKPKLMEKIERMEAIELKQLEKESFAKSSIPLRFDEHLKVQYTGLLTPHREEDTKNDIYTVLNVVQENLIRGGVTGTNKETGRAFTSKPISSISNDVNINKGLWDMAERIVFIKETQMQMVA